MKWRWNRDVKHWRKLKSRWKRRQLMRNNQNFGKLKISKKLTFFLFPKLTLLSSIPVSQALTSTLCFDVHACSTVISDQQSWRDQSLYIPPRQGELPRAHKKIKNKKIQRRSLTWLKKPTYETWPRTIRGGREGNVKSDQSMAGDMAVADWWR